jgi:hypothetical protein
VRIARCRAVRGLTTSVERCDLVADRAFERRLPPSLPFGRREVSDHDQEYQDSAV